MTKDELIKKVFSEDGFKRLCDRLCNHTDLGNDLYQEFMLTLCEMPEETLVESYNKGLINFFCVRVITNINRKKDRLIRDGQQNTLLQLSSFCYNVNRFNDTDDEDKNVPGNLTYDPVATEIYQTARQLLREDMESDDYPTRRDAGRLYETCFLHKNLYQYSLTQPISKQAIMKSVKKASNKLRKRL